jgi:7-carboxy-7-deazaguanine synthase
LVTSMFFTLQGEGPYTGQPALFIRLAKCNLACSFCDTYFDSGEWFTYEELQARMEQTIRVFFNGSPPTWANDVKGSRRKMVLVITGGEPSLQSTNLLTFLMSQKFQNIQIESNGILAFDKPWFVTLVISPKCDSSETSYLKPNPKSLINADCLKFVVNADPKSPYHEVPSWALEWREKTRKPIYLSPMAEYLRHPVKAKPGSADFAERSEVNERISFWESGLLDMAKAQANHEWAGAYALRHGLTMGMQLHLFASMA